ncbi:MAG: UDP-N-acetylglucosamine 1-carboxyvinyltransferase [Bacteroidota bacterium]
MSTFIIQGGHSLQGTITPQGAKNEALQVICAVLLTSSSVTIHNVPDIIDVQKLIALLRILGVRVTSPKRGTYYFDPSHLDGTAASTKVFKENAAEIRGGIMMLGPLLARFGKVTIPKPGGDRIGRRRLDTHFMGMLKLGATFSYNDKEGTYSVIAPRLQGKYILLDEASVTGTANLIMAASLAQGTTTLYNAACEPYIQQLCKMLVQMGAKIEGIGSNLLTIHGVQELQGATHTLLPDMIEVGSFIGLAAMSKANLTIKNVCVDQLGPIITEFRRLGIQLEIEHDDIIVHPQEHYEIKKDLNGALPTIADAVWPGFPTDLMSIMVVVATQAKGTALIHQKMFESRLFFVDNLIEMGAQLVLCDPHRASVTGLDRAYPLRGIRMHSPDIRAGISLLIAALSAKGTSIIENIGQIDRGYERLDTRLRALGAAIERID